MKMIAFSNEKYVKTKFKCPTLSESEPQLETVNRSNYRSIKPSESEIHQNVRSFSRERVSRNLAVLFVPVSYQVDNGLQLVIKNFFYLSGRARATC